MNVLLNNEWSVMMGVGFWLLTCAKYPCVQNTRRSRSGLSIVRYAIAITISKVGQYSIANRFPIAISIVRPSQYTIVYWYPCSILNIVVKGRHSKAAEVL